VVSDSKTIVQSLIGEKIAKVEFKCLEKVQFIALFVEIAVKKLYFPLQKN
jgi:hypothetical protein